MQTSVEVAEGLNERFGAVGQWFAQCQADRFIFGPEGRWTAGQHLDHLIRSVKPLNLALRLPRLALRMKFGTAPSPGDGLDALVARYEARLAEGGKASGRFVPPQVVVGQKNQLMEDFTREGTRLVEAVKGWSEADLDKYLLPHPLLGNLTVREMLFFTWHHLGHHLETLERDYT